MILMSCSLAIGLSACGDKDVDEDKEAIENVEKEEEKGYDDLAGETEESIPVEYRNQISAKLDGKIEDFKAQNLSGDNVDKTIFKDNEITILNVWSNKEGHNDLKELQKLYSEVKDEDVNIIGILHNKDETKEAEKTIKSNKVEFINLIPDESLEANLLNEVGELTTTIFVNSKGEIVGDSILGPVSLENYKKALRVAKEHNKDKK